MRRLRLTLGLLLILLANALRAETIYLTNGEWPPYLGEHLPHYGVASRIVSEAFAEQGIRVDWSFYPWSRALLLAERGKRDGAAIWLRSPEREARFHISDPVVESRYVLLHRADYPFEWSTIADLARHRLGAAQDYFYGEAFTEAERSGQLQVKRLNSEEQGLRMLLAKRIDLFPMDEVVALTMLAERFTPAERGQLVAHAQPLHSQPLHLLLSREIPANAERMQRFNLGLKALRERGRIAGYLEQIGDLRRQPAETSDGVR